MRAFIIFVVMLFSAFMLSLEAAYPKKKVPQPATYTYEANPYVSPEVWDRLRPFFLPDNHPLKPKLDEIFKGSRVTLSLDGFKKAGFSKYKIRDWSHMVVAFHPKLPGIVVKAFLDTELKMVDWEMWIHRIYGAQAVRECIARHGYEKYFKVPAKWIYPLPAKPSPPFGELCEEELHPHCARYEPRLKK